MKRTKIIVIAALITLIAGVFFVRRLGPYSTLRRIVTRDIGIDRLQDWAISVIDNPPEHDFDRSIRSDALPDELLPLSRFGQFVYVPGLAKDPSDDHVLVACGGGFYHFGLRIGRRGFKPVYDSQFAMELLADGVWGLYER